MGLNIVLNLILGRYLAHGGITLATALAVWWGALVPMVGVRCRGGPISYRELARRYLFGELTAADLSGRPVGFVPLAAEVAALAAIGTAAYAAVRWWFRVEKWVMVRELVTRFNRRLRRFARPPRS